MNNIVYFSGSHGSGKSTLIKKLAEKDPELFFVYQKMPLPQKFQEMLPRQNVRLARYYLRVNYLKELSKKEPNKILLCDRCSYDNLAYVKGFMNLGWISKEIFEDHLHMHDFLMIPKLRPKNIVFVNPPLEDVIKNIKKRWKETGRKKWREDNFNYLIAVRKGFENVYSKVDASILEIKFMDLEKRVSECYSWTKKLKTY